MEDKEKILIHTSNKVVEIQIGSFEGTVDIDELTKIDYSNLYGEAITVSALLNKCGILRAQAEEQYEDKKLEHEIYDAERRKELRRQAVDNSGKMQVGKEWVKLTIDSLNEAMVLDPGWQVKKKNVIKAKKDLDFVESIYWSVQSKDRKLSVLVKGVTPEELANEIIEGTINTLVIKKHSKKLTK